MNRTSFRRALSPAVAAIAAISLTACGAANEEDADANASDGASLSGTLNGGGASSQEAAQTAWRAGFQSAQGSGVTVNYDPVGSGGGRENFIAGAFAFAGSDSYLADEELAAATETCAAEPIQVPAYISPVAIVHNLDGVELNLSADVIAQIFDGKITKWNDPAIAELNDGADLPDATINAVHRSDDSGTTENFTNYLANVAPDAWPHGEVESWPINHGEGATGTSGVISAVKDTPNSIGYADASQAGDLGKVNVGVGDSFVAPSPEAAAKILEVSPRVEGRADVDMAVDIDYASNADGVYPIVMASYLLACQSYDDANTAELVKGYLTYVVSSEGQATAAENAGSAPLSPALSDEATRIVSAISAN